MIYQHKIIVIIIVGATGSRTTILFTYGESRTATIDRGRKQLSSRSVVFRILHLL